MKIKEKAVARQLRKDGCSIKEIAKKLKVSVSSVSLWCRNIILPYDKRIALAKRQGLGGARTKKLYRKKREVFQFEGTKRIRCSKSSLFISGCMLYWAEGTKNRKQISFANADVDMMKFFVRFLIECFDFSKERLAISIHCYTDLHSQKEIENYWLQNLGLSCCCLKKTIVNAISIESKKKRFGKLPYGTCHLRLSDVRIVQQIWGAIQKFVGFERLEWLG